MKILSNIKRLTNEITFSFGNTYKAIFSASSINADRTYTLPNRSGTLADDTDLGGKQATLVSGDNIKTINGNNILGAGNVSITYEASALKVSTDTQYISTERNYLGAIGSPVIGDISLVQNALDTNWVFGDVLDTKLNLLGCDYTTHNSGLAEFYGSKVIADLAKFSELTVDESWVTYQPTIMYGVDFATNVNIMNGSELEIISIETGVYFSGIKGGTLRTKKVHTNTYFTGICEGIFNIFIEDVKQSTTIGGTGTFTVGSVVNVHINNLSEALNIQSLDLSNCQLNVYVKSSGTSGRILLDGITVNDSSNINIQGTFMNDSNGDTIYCSSSTNVGSTHNRINITNSIFRNTNISYTCIGSATGALGFNISNTILYWNGSADVVVAEDTGQTYFFNSITDEGTGDKDYSSDTNYLGVLTQDTDFN